MPMLSGHSRGFTLWESLIVLLILSVIAALSFPNLRHWQIRMQENAEARALLAAFQQARSEAARSNGRAFLEFTPAEEPPAQTRGGYRILATDSAGQLREIQAFTPLRALHLEGVGFAQGSARAGFDFRGMPTHGSGTLSLRSPHNGSVHRLTMTLYGAVRLNP
ncbi:prepilin-type N-terminal cleavage/methylation domain-containing protein [Geoalkalibacter ferrihydriticus]|nr:GspH/FimT family protein [Geoalkalibacter ferrihydriticus]SDM93820.1 prepilin-type N-terminal cleavage/methylation domain-containing protein [Geoalkalibacter ferrihydriticus]